MNAIYLIRKMNLIGQTIYVYNEIPISQKANFIYSESNKIKKVIDEGAVYENCRYYEISKTPKGVDMDKTELLPYFAKVTEDIPPSIKVRPTTYNRCQLTTQFPGGYLVFKCMETGKLLKIAMNSHFYEPIK